MLFAALTAGLGAGCANTPPRIGANNWLEPPNAIAWAPDGATIAVEQRDTTWLLDLASGASRELIRRQTQKALVFSRDGRLLVGSAIQTGGWELRSGRLAWRVDRAWIACATDGGFALRVPRDVLIVDARTGKGQAMLGPEPYAGIGGVECSPDGRFLARAYPEGVVSIWDIEARRKLGVLRVRDGDEPYRVALAPGARSLAAWIGDRVSLFSPDQWARVNETELPPVARPTAAINLRSRAAASRRVFVVSSDGRYLAAAGTSVSGWILAKGALELVDLESMRVEQLPRDFATDLAFSPDGRWLAVLGLRGIELWDIRRGAFGSAIP